MLDVSNLFAYELVIVIHVFPIKLSSALKFKKYTCLNQSKSQILFKPSNPQFKNLSLLDFFNKDCEPDFIDSDYAYDKLVRVKVSDGKSVIFSFLEKYLSLSFRNFDFVLETEMAGGSTISINANGTTLKTLKNTGVGTIKEAYRIFIYTQDETKRKINIVKISDLYDEYTIV